MPARHSSSTKVDSLPSVPLWHRSSVSFTVGHHSAILGGFKFLSTGTYIKLPVLSMISSQLLLLLLRLSDARACLLPCQLIQDGACRWLAALPPQDYMPLLGNGRACIIGGVFALKRLFLKGVGSFLENTRRGVGAKSTWLKESSFAFIPYKRERCLSRIL